MINVMSAARPDVWVLRAGGAGQYAEQFQRRGLVAIGFTPEPFKGRSVEGLSRAQIRNVLASMFRDSTPRSLGQFTGQVLAFACEMKKGDLVLTPMPRIKMHGEHRDDVLYGLIEGPYRFSDTPIAHRYIGSVLRNEDEIVTGCMPHERQVRWLGRIARDSLPDETSRKLGVPRTLFRAGGAEEVINLLLKGGLAPAGT